MAYDSAREVTVLFGGIGVSGDTWEWDGDDWTLRSTAGPVRRFGHAMAYDSGRGVTVLFGGSGDDGDTWEWDGANWTQRSVTGPPPRQYHAMAYDSDRGVTMLFGGIRSPFGSTDFGMWEWDGTTWTLRPDPRPPRFSRYPMAYDSARGVALLLQNAAGWTWEYKSEFVQADTLQADVAGDNKNRYLSVVPGNIGGLIALRVMPLDLPQGLGQFEGVPMWVNGLSVVCENPGQTLEFQCGPAPGLANPEMLTATLGCTPEYLDWGSTGLVHVYGEAIVPGGSYEVQAIHLGCDASVEDAFSVPLDVATSVWGDVVGPFDPANGRWSAPDGDASVVFDVVSIIEKFSSAIGAPLKARADLQPSVPDQIIDTLDLIAAIDAFRGIAYPFTPSSPPCP